MTSLETGNSPSGSMAVKKPFLEREEKQKRLSYAKLKLQWHLQKMVEALSWFELHFSGVGDLVHDATMIANTLLMQ